MIVLMLEKSVGRQSYEREAIERKKSKYRGDKTE